MVPRSSYITRLRFHCTILPGGGGGGACLIGACTSSVQIKKRVKRVSFSPPGACVYRVKWIENRKIWKKKYQIYRSPGQGKGRKFGSDTPVHTHGVVFRELWVSSLHPRLGCFSERDLRGWCTGPNETCPPPPVFYPVYVPYLFIRQILWPEWIKCRIALYSLAYVRYVCVAHLPCYEGNVAPG